MYLGIIGITWRGRMGATAPTIKIGGGNALTNLNIIL